MSIENTLERIANALEKIANKSEAKQEQAAEVAKFTAQLESVSEPVATKSTGRPKKEKEVKEPIGTVLATPTTSSITIEVLRARARQLGELDRPSAVAIVTGFGVPTLGDIPVDKYEAAYALFDTKVIELTPEVL